MGGGHTSAVKVAPTPATPTRDSTTTQSLANAQAQRYAGPSTFTNSILTGYAGSGLGTSTGAGSSLLGG